MTVLAIAILIGGLTLFNQISYNLNGKIDDFKSANNLLSLFSTGGFFSRTAILFLNLVNLRASSQINTTIFDNIVSNYSTGQLIFNFPESTFTEFQPFQDQLNQMQYQYMCTYLICDPAYLAQINIIYTTTIQKMIATAQTWKSQLNTINSTSLASLIKNGSLGQFINLIYYT